MNNSLISILQNFIMERKLNDVTIHLLGNNITQKKAKQFMSNFKQFFPYDGGYKYEYNKGRVTISNQSSQLKIDFKFQEQQSIFIQDISSKIFSFEILSNQVEFIRIIKQNIQNQTDNCHVQLCFEKKTYFIFTNGNIQNQNQITLNFEDKNDLASFYVDGFLLIESFDQENTFQYDNICKQIKSKYIYQIIQESTPYFSLSFSTQNITFKCVEKMQDYLKKYQFAFEAKFQIGFKITSIIFKQLVFNFLFQYNEQQYKYPHTLNLSLIGLEQKYESNNQILILKTIQNVKIQRKQFNMEFQQEENMLDFLQYYLDSLRSRNIINNLKLSYNDHSSQLKQFDTDSFQQGLEKINFYNQVNKLSLNLQSQISAYPFIANLQSLFTINISFQSLGGILSFLKQNRSNFNIQNNQTKLICLIIRFYENNLSDYFDRQNKFITDHIQFRQLQFSKQDYERICEIQYIQDNQYPTPTNLNLIFSKFKRLVNYELKSCYYFTQNKEVSYDNGYPNYFFNGEFYVCQCPDCQDFMDQIYLQQKMGGNYNVDFQLDRNLIKKMNLI
ncbi:hypothetical protein ABPG74_013484 [Tetrahymena malaccensis]